VRIPSILGNATKIESKICLVSRSKPKEVQFGKVIFPQAFEVHPKLIIAVSTSIVDEGSSYLAGHVSEFTTLRKFICILKRSRASCLKILQGERTIEL